MVKDLAADDPSFSNGEAPVRRPLPATSGMPQGLVQAAALVVAVERSPKSPVLAPFPQLLPLLLPVRAAAVTSFVRHEIARPVASRDAVKAAFVLLSVAASFPLRDKSAERVARL